MEIKPATWSWSTVEWPNEKPLNELANDLFASEIASGSFSLGAREELVAKDYSRAKPGTKSARRGLQTFPLHTDQASKLVPPRYILLRAFSASESPTYLLPVCQCRLTTELRLGLTEGLWAFRGSRTPHISSVVDDQRIRWDEDCMRPLDKSAKKAHRQFSELLSRVETHHVEWTNSKTVLVIDNWRTLHGRASVKESEHRILERLYLEAS